MEQFIEITLGDELCLVNVNSITCITTNYHNHKKQAIWFGENDFITVEESYEEIKEKLKECIK